MSATSTTPTEAMATYFALDSNPYAEVPTTILADTLEAQHDRGEPLNPEMVFEVVDATLAGVNPRVLRLASTAAPRDDRTPELMRLFGSPVEVGVAVRQIDPVSVARAVHELGARAVLAESFRGDLGALAQAIDPVPVLRPMFTRRPGHHAGPPTDQFVGYGRLLATGEVVAIDDGAMALPDL
jgi:hypothetical protein